jgi:hypothetical protein
MTEPEMEKIEKFVDTILNFIYKYS